MVQITEGKRADVTFLDDLVIEPGAIYIMDRGQIMHAGPASDLDKPEVRRHLMV